MDTLQAFRPQLKLNFAESLFVGNAVGGQIGTKEDFVPYDFVFTI